ncbi:hypothetical protein AXK11_00145 [Cephaloticoccus primus]|uniref:Uncharacterized protein n=2 Tax=Cephaloticoccus primus TaxID=1548207 RepID=A0A139ST42_9BACT|nr:hypothetical protein AXK11_00145 [Cephaloticoccus primus]
MTGAPTPKSYLSEAERAEILAEGEVEDLYLEESSAARDAGDMDACWAWLARAEHPAHSLVRLKRRHGASFIRKWGFNDTLARAKYGDDWLEKEYDLYGQITG